MALFMRYLVRLLQKVEMRELRSHFADGKSMSVEYEFKINDKNLKYLDRLDLLKRNTSLTPGKLDVLNLMKKVALRTTRE